MTKKRAIGILGCVVVFGLAGCGKSKGAEALANCKAADQKATGVDKCFEAWTATSSEHEWFELTDELDKRIDAVCKADPFTPDCDKACKRRIAAPGPQSKSNTMQMCVVAGYGTFEGVVASGKPHKLYTEMSFEVVEGCVADCHGRDPGTQTSSDEYQGCMRACKPRKIAELSGQ